MDTAVKAVIVKNGRFLVLEQVVEGKTRYSLPGGRVQSANLEEELKREVLEETGLTVEIEKYLGEWFFVREHNNLKTVCKTYLCSIVSGELGAKGKEAYEDIQKYLWLSKEEFLSGNYTNNESLIYLVKSLII